MARLFVAANSERFLVNEVVASGSPVSIGCWFYAVNATNDDYCLLQLTDEATADNFFRLGFAGSRGGATGREIQAFVGGSADADAAQTADATLNQWQHALAVFPDVNSRTAYLDGVGTTNNNAVTHPTGIDVMNIGWEGDSTPGDPWDGRIAHVAVWEGALTADDAAMLAAGVSPLKVRRDLLIFYAPLWLASGDERDYVGEKTLTDVNTVGNASGPNVMGMATGQNVALPPRQGTGAPSIAPVEASGTAKVKRMASGAATLAAIVAAGTVALTHNCSGAATLASVEASGMATVESAIIANGAATTPAVEASGTAEIVRNANGAATIPAVEASGNAVKRNSASGGGTIAPVEAAGTASVTNSASGAATLGPVEASGTATVVNSASGAATLAAIESAGTVDLIRNATGAAVLAAIEGAGTAALPIVSASGAATIPAAVASGVAQIPAPGCVYESITAQTEALATDTTTVNSVPGGTDQLYLVHINIYTNGGTPGTSEVLSVTGGGLTFALVSGSVSCSGRISQPRQETWWAFGSPSTFNCVVTLDNTTQLTSIIRT
jgi:hypothetical protein